MHALLKIGGPRGVIDFRRVPRYVTKWGRVVKIGPKWRDVLCGRPLCIFVGKHEEMKK